MKVDLRNAQKIFAYCTHAFVLSDSKNSQVQNFRDQYCFPRKFQFAILKRPAILEMEMSILRLHFRNQQFRNPRV